MEHITTGVPPFDYSGKGACPGLPRGRIVHAFGDVGSGKTTLALLATAAATRQQIHCAYLDRTGSVTPDFATQCGVDLDFLSIVLLEDEEDAVNYAHNLLPYNLGLLVFDGVGPLGDYTPQRHEEFARSHQRWAHNLPPLKQKAQKRNTCILGLSLVDPPSEHEPTPRSRGGSAWRFIASRRILLASESLNTIRWNVCKDTLDMRFPNTATGALTIPS